MRDYAIIAWKLNSSIIIINPRRACAGVTVVVLCVCLSVCVCVCVCVSVRNLNLGTGASRGLNEGTSE